MKYLCLVYAREALLEALSDGASAALAAESIACDEELALRGHLVLSHALQRVKHARVVQLRQGRMSRRDGPFVETRDPLQGFILVEADDLNAAIQVAARVPLARMGSIEVRPVARVDRIEGSVS